MAIRLCGLLLLGCTANPEPADSAAPDSTNPGFCGSLSTFEAVTISGSVRSAEDNRRMANVDLALEERNWDPGRIHGTARSDANGNFTFVAEDLPVVEDCWGTAVSYWLTGVVPGWSGDKPMNAELLAAWEAGEVAVSTDPFPLILRRVEAR